MSVRFDAIGDYYSDTTSGVTGTAITVTCWFNIRTDRNTYSGIWSIGDTGSPAFMLCTDSNGTTLVLFDSGLNMLGTFAATVGTWYRAVATCNGTAFTLGIGAAGAALTTYSGSMVSPWNPSPALRVGDTLYGGEWLNGSVANLKVYLALLTAAEAATELAFAQPVRTQNLLRLHNFREASTVDYSGNGNSLTAGGTATATDDGPPTLWSPHLLAAA